MRDWTRYIEIPVPMPLPDLSTSYGFRGVSSRESAGRKIFVAHQIHPLNRRTPCNVTEAIMRSHSSHLPSGAMLTAAWDHCSAYVSFLSWRKGINEPLRPVSAISAVWRSWKPDSASFTHKPRRCVVIVRGTVGHQHLIRRSPWTIVPA